MTEQIGVTYRPIYVGGVRTPGHHMALFYDDGKGTTKVIEVAPSIFPPGILPQSEAAIKEHFFSNSNTDSPYGRIAGGERPWRPTDALLPSSVLAEGDDLSSQWNLVRARLEDVMRRGYEYQSPFDQNSNTFARDAAEKAQLPVPNGIARDIAGHVSTYWTPGASRLSNPINAASVFDIGAPAVPFAPANNPFAPTPSASFNDRFGNWPGSMPTQSPSAPEQPNPQKSVADLIMDHIRRVKQQNASTAPSVPNPSATTASAPNAQYTAAGGLPAWLGSVAGIDPSNPFQPTPPVDPSIFPRLVRVPPD